MSSRRNFDSKGLELKMLLTNAATERCNARCKCFLGAKILGHAGDSGKEQATESRSGDYALSQE